MSYRDMIEAVDNSIDMALIQLSATDGGIFNAIRSFLDGFNDGVQWLLATPPYYVIALLVGLLAWRTVGWRFGLGAFIGLLFCEVMQLWSDTIGTLSLVITATFLALLVAIPIGIVAGYNERIRKVTDPIMDMMQTFPPYIYLLPGIALLGYGHATAVASTFIVAVPPALRLTALGFRMTPTAFSELGAATGLSPANMFFKIRLPFAMPSIMAGINQSIMLAFGMVVIAGIVGSGGLGETIYKAIVQLNVAKSIDAAIAIVIITIILDRLTQAIHSTEAD